MLSIESKLLFLAEMLYATLGPLADELQDSHLREVVGDYRRWRNGELVAAYGEAGAVNMIETARTAVFEYIDLQLWADEMA